MGYSIKTGIIKHKQTNERFVVTRSVGTQHTDNRQITGYQILEIWIGMLILRDIILWETTKQNTGTGDNCLRQETENENAEKRS